MALSKITYTDKETLNEQPSIADKNKVSDDDMNEIKRVVNINADKVGDLDDLDTTNKNSIVEAINELKDGEIYSTSEIKTNKVWINNKPIYRMVVEEIVNSNTNAEYLLSSLGITNQDMIRINLGDSTAHYGDTIGGAYSSISYYVSSTDRAHTFIDASLKLRIQNQNSNQRTYYVVLEYTKTTD